MAHYAYCSVLFTIFRHLFLGIGMNVDAWKSFGRIPFWYIDFIFNIIANFQRVDRDSIRAYYFPALPNFHIVISSAFSVLYPHILEEAFI